ncbi:MAG: glycoside hydrolase family 3 C-terminal domain-containing protein [Candidatus Marinimicrobia bacterium]|nr:glycoside hydrolase family 3 C-terminal domain-containing protein [Candidatus Neomarinimicrobiota bacterium]
MKIRIFILILFLLYRLDAQEPVYLDSTRSVAERTEDLLSKMTLAEKIGQITQADHAAISDRSDVTRYFLGSVLSGGGSDPDSDNRPEQWTDLYDNLQSNALQTRLAIPIIYGVDAVHGHSNVVGATIFPHNIGLGATRNPDLMKTAGRVTAIEIAATGIDWTFAPCIAVPRDERWGRTYEGFGEAPELAVDLGSAFIRGLQGDSLNHPTSIVACAKHYLGDGGTTNGDDQGNTQITEQELRNIHLPGYIAAIRDNVKTIMASYNSWNGSKLHGSKYLLTDLLKNELGFEGFIVSDWAAIDQLPGDYKSDIEVCINAGIDMVMVPNNYVDFITLLTELVNEGKISMDRIDEAVRRILKVKFELGLFERPYADRTLMPEIGKQEHRDVARQCVRESQVLLKKNDNILPLPKNNMKILVAGEHADNIGLQCGGWTIQWQGQSGDITEGTTILEALQKVAPDAEIVYNINGNFDDDEADYAVVIIGEQPYAEGGGDTDDLTIRDEQIQLVRQLKNKGLKVVTILISGRPMIIAPVLHNSDAFFAAFLPGTEGDGIAELLFGDYEPSGLSPVTWQKSNDMIPMNWGDMDYDPLFPYGFGITSYENSESGSAPIFQSAMITEDGKHIELAFNKSMNNENNISATFSVLNNGSQRIPVESFGISATDEKIIVLTLSETLEYNLNLTVSYESGNISAEDNGKLAVFSDGLILDIRDYMPKMLTIPGKIEAEDWSQMEGVQTEGTTDIGGGVNVGWIDNNDWINYHCYVENSGTYKLNFRVAAQSNTGRLKFIVDGYEKFNLDLPVTGGWQSWRTISHTVNLEEGEQTFWIFAERGGWNLNWIDFALIETGIEDNVAVNNYQLENNYPNPFNPETTICYFIPQKSMVKLTVYDLTGKMVKPLVTKEQPAGHYTVNFNGDGLSSGIYFYRLETENFYQTKQMVLVR